VYHIRPEASAQLPNQAALLKIGPGRESQHNHLDAGSEQRGDEPVPLLRRPDYQRNSHAMPALALTDRQSLEHTLQPSYRTRGGDVQDRQRLGSRQTEPPSHTYPSCRNHATLQAMPLGMVNFGSYPRIR